MGGFGHLLRGHLRRRGPLYTVVCLTFVIGAFIGGATVSQLSDDYAAALAGDVEQMFYDGMEPSGSLFTPFTRLREPSVSLMTVAADALTGYGGVVPVVGLAVLLGLSVIGAPFMLAFVFWRGFALGFSVTFFVHRFLWRGVLLAAVTFVPHNILAVPGVIVAAAGAIGFSWSIVVVLFGRRGGNIYGPMVRTGVMLVGSALLLIGGALLEAYVTPLLMDAAVELLYWE